MDANKQWNDFVETTREVTYGTVESADTMARRMANTQPAAAAREVADHVEGAVADPPTNALWRVVWMSAAGAAALASLGMMLSQRKHEALFLGQWTPVFLMTALWGQTVRK